MSRMYDCAMCSHSSYYVLRVPLDVNICVHCDNSSRTTQMRWHSVMHMLVGIHIAVVVEVLCIM
jgi:hypothetical protein